MTDSSEQAKAQELHAWLMRERNRTVPAAYFALLEPIAAGTHVTISLRDLAHFVFAAFPVYLKDEQLRELASGKITLEDLSNQHRAMLAANGET